jgi:hypothetical protein
MADITGMLWATSLHERSADVPDVVQLFSGRLVALGCLSAVW